MKTKGQATVVCPFLFADIICVICIYLGFAQAGFYKVEDLVLGYAQDGWKLVKEQIFRIFEKTFV